MSEPIRGFARIYLRVSTDEQDLQRQETLVTSAKAAGYYVAGVYREKASGAIANRPEIIRMIGDLQTGDVVIAERIDRISRLPLAEAETLIGAIRNTGAKLVIPGIVDLEDLIAESSGVAKIVLDAVQSMLLRIALQMAREDYETRRERQRQGIDLAQAAGRYKGKEPNVLANGQIVTCRMAGMSIATTAKTVGVSASQVKRVWKAHQQSRQSHEVTG